MLATGRIWNNDAVRFCIIFFSCLLVFAVIYLKLRTSTIIDPFLAFNTWLASSILNILGESTQADGVTIASSAISFRVISECTSIVPTGILAAGVLAWPSTIKEKFVGVAFGTVALFIINMVRIVTLYYIGIGYPDFLDVAHYFIWQGLIILIALGLWLLWTEKLVSPISRTSNFEKESKHDEDQETL